MTQNLSLHTAVVARDLPALGTRAETIAEKIDCPLDIVHHVKTEAVTHLVDHLRQKSSASVRRVCPSSREMYVHNGSPAERAIAVL
jgi:hypothetical protein